MNDASGQGRGVEPFRIRSYQPGDRGVLGKICVETGNSGLDATGKFYDDQLLPMVYAYPYVRYAPELCWVVEQDREVVGYILGVEDVPDFDSWWQKNWVPCILQLYPSDRGMDAQSKELRRVALAKGSEDPGFRTQYPGEFHVDLLPPAQGRGVGRALVEKFAATLRMRGVPGIAIGVSGQNTNALAFYKRLGFEVLETHTVDGITAGLTLKRDL